MRRQALRRLAGAVDVIDDVVQWTIRLVVAVTSRA